MYVFVQLCLELSDSLTRTYRIIIGLVKLRRNTVHSEVESVVLQVLAILVTFVI